MADAHKLTIVLVTPIGEKIAGSCDEIVAPGELGQFGVLPGHIDFFSASRPGVLTVIDGGKKSYWALGKGFIEVGADHVSLLVQSAEPAAEIDTARAERARKRAEDALAKLAGDAADPTFDDQSLRLARAEARLAAAAMLNA